MEVSVDDSAAIRQNSARRLIGSTDVKDLAGPASVPRFPAKPLQDDVIYSTADALTSARKQSEAGMVLHSSIIIIICVIFILFLLFFLN